MPVFDNIADTVGNTPIVRLHRLDEAIGARLFAKLEAQNPCASIKDRIGVAMIRDAERAGKLKPGSVIVEATSGNTGIALAFATAAAGYRLVITMPETMSRERVSMLRLLGAEIVLTPGGMMKTAVDEAFAIAERTPGAVMLKQFSNPANPGAHEQTTGPEIWADMDGAIDAFVAGVGTGGTITGVGRFLRSKGSQAKLVAVEPTESAVLSGGKPGQHYIQGIGAGFVPDNLDKDLLDEIVTVTEKQAIDCARRLSSEEGILAGISCGAAAAAALEIGGRSDMADKNIVVVFPDSGERYLSTRLAEDLAR